jgi:hypothetical protein
VGVRGEVVADVAEGVLDLPEGLVVGEVGQLVGEALQERVVAEGLEDALAAFFAPFRDGVSGARVNSLGNRVTLGSANLGSNPMTGNILRHGMPGRSVTRV